MINKARAHNDQTPRNNQESHGPFDTESDESHITGKFEDSITREEKEETDRVSCSDCQSKFFSHSGDLSLADIDTINDRHTLT